MPLIFHPGAPERTAAVLLEEARRQEALAADLRRLAADAAPSPAELAAAPLLQDWTWLSRSVRCLGGTVQEHPVLPDGRIRTSEVLVHAPSQHWVRTLSRWYVLGRPSADGPEAAHG